MALSGQRSQNSKQYNEIPQYGILSYAIQSVSISRAASCVHIALHCHHYGTQWNSIHDINFYIQRMPIILDILQSSLYHSKEKILFKAIYYIQLPIFLHITR